MTRTDRAVVDDSADALAGLSISSRRDSTGSYEHVNTTNRPASLLSSSADTDITSDLRARLIYVKSHVAIHPTQLKRDHISGILGLVEVDKEVPRAPDSGSSAAAGTTKEVLIVWVPDELFQRLSDEDRRKYQRVEGRSLGAPPTEEDGFVFVSLPAPKGGEYAFSVPVSKIYSMLVYPPSLSHWYGSATFNLLGGVSLPTLYFHDDQTPLVTTPRSSTPPSPVWGFPPFLKVLEHHATLLRSRLVTAMNNRGGELWLVNPSRGDREVHEAGYEESNSSQGRNTPAAPAYPPPASFPALSAPTSQPTPRDSLLVSLSNITNLARHTAQNVLNHPLAKPVVPHLPPAFRSLVTAQGEWESARLTPKSGSSRSSDVASEFESARLYLARWARVVAEEGERSRRGELAAQAGMGDSGTTETSLGVFSLLPSASKRPQPKPTRTPQHPITTSDWYTFIVNGNDELFVRREIFRRGFSDEPEEEEGRKQGWEVILGVVPWSVEVGPDRLAQRNDRRDKVLKAKRDEYARLYAGWREKTQNGEAPEAWKEEWHRIDVDCRRTDRTQPIYQFTPENVTSGDEEKEGGGAGAGQWGVDDKEEEGGHAQLNSNIKALRNVLMTYHVEAPDLGYVQGMSDLLSPIYYVFAGDEAASLYGLTGVMKIMESNFLRDQSGMRRQLSTLQQLIGLMDPELYAHLEKTESLNLFFCFRWILIAFKREFKFEEVIRLWEVLWTNYYSTNFVLFVALAVLQSHRDVIIRYLTEFDEVLKYANDLTGSIELDSTLAQAEVLFLSFRGIVEEIDKENAGRGESVRQRRGEASTSGSAATTTALEQRSSQRTISPELRELLDHWRPADATTTASENLIDL